MKYNLYSQCLIFTILLLFTLAPNVLSQLPYGENTIRVSTKGFTSRVTVTPKHIYFSEFDLRSGKWLPREELNFRPHLGDEIVDGAFKKGDASYYLILLSSGKVEVYDLYNDEVVDETTISNENGFSEIIGDALYTLTSSGVFVLRDTVTKVWNIDSTGLESRIPFYLAMDSSQNVFATTGAGLFKQSPDSSVWHKVNSYPTNYASTIFVDKKNRIYVSSFNNVYYSTDDGNTWTSNDNGLAGLNVLKFGEDVFNNIYAIQSNAVFRSDNGTGAWVRIDAPITNQIEDAINQYASPYNDVCGDSTLFLATNYGLFQSTDKGNTWTENNRGIRATTIYGFAKSSSRSFVTTNLGLFYQNQNDTTWTKSFPVKGYKTGSAIFMDNNGSLYTLGAQTDNTNSNSPQTNWKSIDNGTTWQPDTNGLSAISGQLPQYFVDENGNQHYADGVTVTEVYLKTASGSWTLDTAGLGANVNNMYPDIFASDYHGNIYAAFTNTTTNTGLLFKRAITGGSWTEDDNGLNGAIIYSISADQNGNLYAGTWGGGLYKNSGGAWSSVSLPNGMQSNFNVFVTAVTKSGALFAGFSTQDANYNYIWHGVYYTTDGGSRWKYAGLDSISVRQLVAYGDTVYAVTYNDGLYVLTANSATKIKTENPAVVQSYKLEQNYPNPFNPTTAISFQLSAFSHVTLKVYDVLGREVKTLVNEYRPAGKYTVNFDASKLASGVYFYRISAGSFNGVKKMMMLK